MNRLLFIILILIPILASSQVKVKGYFKGNGTYVFPHYRSNPDGYKYNNWSTRGNINPYTLKEGTKNDIDFYTPNNIIPKYDEKNELENISNINRFKYIGRQESYDFYIDRKICNNNGMYWVWTKMVLSSNYSKERSRLTSSNKLDYSKYLYSLNLELYDLVNKRIKILQSSDYGYDDKLITTDGIYLDSAKWDDIIKGSLGEFIFNNVKEEFENQNK